MSSPNQLHYDKIKAKIDFYPLLKSIEQKINLLYEIYTESSAALDNGQLDCDQCMLEQLQNIQTNAKDLLKALLNTKTDEEMLLLVQKMQKLQKFDPRYLPEKKPIEIFDVENLSPDLKHGEYGLARLALLNFLLKQRKIMRVNEHHRIEDEKDAVLMLDQEKRQEHRVFIKNGLFYKLNQAASFSEANDFIRCHTLTMQSHYKNFYAAYVITTKGEIYLFEHKEELLRHSSMTAGNAVFAAGEMIIIDGKLTKISTYSGHYEPDLHNTYMTLKYLQRQGVNIKSIKINDVLEQFKYHQDASIADIFVHSESGIRAKLLANTPLLLSTSETTVNFVELLASDVVAWGDSLQLAKCPSIYNILFMLNSRIQREIECLIQDLIEIKDDIATPIITTCANNDTPSCALLAEQHLSVAALIKQLREFAKRIKEQMAKLLKQEHLYSHDVNLIRKTVKAYLDDRYNEIKNKYPDTNEDKDIILTKISDTKEKLRF